MKWIIKFLLYLWQLPQILLGEIVWFFCLWKNRIVDLKVKSKEYPSVDASVHVYNLRNSNNITGFSMGRRIFLFYNEVLAREKWKTEYKAMQRRYITHEYGHSIQSCYLGFFYFIVIGLPSLFFTGFNSAQAKRMYMERWAERLIRDVVLEDVEEPP